jgi:hypothetical protein
MRVIYLHLLIIRRLYPFNTRIYLLISIAHQIKIKKKIIIFQSKLGKKSGREAVNISQK